MLLLIPYLFLSTTIAHPVGTYPDLLTGTLGNRNASTLSHQNITQICGTHAPSTSLRQAHADFLEKSRQQQQQQQQRSNNNKKERRSSSISSSSSRIVVTTYVHFVSTTDQSASYPPSVRNAMISSQMSVLNSLYRPALISFRLAATSWTVNDAWATDAGSTQMKQALRRGPYSALNLYFQTNLSSPPYTYTSSGPGSTALLGYCTLPTTITYPVTGSDGAVVAQAEYPTVDYATDGCNVLAGSMPRAPAGLGVRGYELGKTAVHEVGHWFGLLHTFQVSMSCGGFYFGFDVRSPRYSTRHICLFRFFFLKAQKSLGKRQKKTRKQKKTQTQHIPPHTVQISRINPN